MIEDTDFEKIQEIRCRICAQFIKMPKLTEHSRICKEREEIKTKLKAKSDEIYTTMEKAEKRKLHFMAKVQLFR